MTNTDQAGPTLVSATRKLRPLLDQIHRVLTPAMVAGGKEGVSELGAAFQAAAALRYLLDSVQASDDEDQIEALTGAVQRADWASMLMRGRIREIEAREEMEGFDFPGCADCDELA